MSDYSIDEEIDFGAIQTFASIFPHVDSKSWDSPSITSLEISVELDMEEALRL